MAPPEHAYNIYEKLEAERERKGQKIGREVSDCNAKWRDRFKEAVKARELWRLTEGAKELDWFVADTEKRLAQANWQFQDSRQTTEDLLAVQKAWRDEFRAYPKRLKLRRKLQQQGGHAIVRPEPAPRQPEQTRFRLLASLSDVVDVDRTKTMLNVLHRYGQELTFQLTAIADEVSLNLILQKAFAEQFERVLLAYFPHTELQPDEPPAQHRKETRYRFSGTSWPIHTYTDFQPDPFNVFCTLSEQLQPGEALHFSTTFAPAPPAFYKALPPNDEKKAVPPHWMASFFLTADTPDPPGQKNLRPAFDRAAQLLHLAEHHFLHQYRNRHNHLIPWLDDPPAARNFLDSTGHVSLAGREDLDRTLWPQTLLTTPELTGFVHLPHKSITNPCLLRADMQSLKVPDHLTKAPGLLLGVNEYRRQTANVYLPHSSRSGHLYALGGSGSGKSTLLKNLIKQDFDDGAGLAVIDPHGDLVADLLPLIPEQRVKDTIVFDAADRQHSIALNHLEARTPEDQEQVRDEFMTLFQRLFVTGDAPRMLDILRFTITTLVQSGGKTFFDIERVLTSPPYRHRVLASITDERVLRFWEERFPSLEKAIDPILNKLSQFTLSSTVYNILSQPTSQINFYDLMQQRKIFLASVPADIGEENSHLLGSLLVSQIQLAAMRRRSLSPEQRVPFTLYVDEFQNFMSSAFEKILSEARKYKLGIVLAHQYTTQLDDNVRQAIFANTHTKIFFRISPTDANAVRTLLDGVSPDQLTKLERGHAIAAVTGAPAFSLKTFPSPEPPATNSAEAIIAYSRSHYTSTRTARPPRAPEREQQPPTTETPTIEPEGPRKPVRKPKAKAGAEEEHNIFDDLMRNS